MYVPLLAPIVLALGAIFYAEAVTCSDPSYILDPISQRHVADQSLNRLKAGYDSSNPQLLKRSRFFGNGRNANTGTPETPITETPASRKLKAAVDKLGDAYSGLVRVHHPYNTIIGQVQQVDNLNDPEFRKMQEAMIRKYGRSRTRPPLGDTGPASMRIRNTAARLGVKTRMVEGIREDHSGVDRAAEQHTKLLKKAQALLREVPVGQRGDAEKVIQTSKDFSKTVAASLKAGKKLMEDYPA